MIIQTFAAGAVRVARSIEFSMAHFYRQDQMTDAENLKNFGACFTPHGHGHNYRLEVMLEGVPHESTGLLIDRAALDAYLREAVLPLDHHHANFDIPEFKPKTDGSPTLIPTTENLCQYLVDRLRIILSNDNQFSTVSVKLYEMADLWVEWTPSEAGLSLNADENAFLECTHEVSFNSTRQRTAGSGTELSGHHYRLQVSLRQIPNAVNFEKFLKEKIFDWLDGKSLNQVLPEIQHTTPEFLLRALAERIQNSEPGAKLAKIALYDDGANGHCEMRVLN